MYLLNEPTQDLPLQSIRPSLPGSSCLIFLLLSIRHNWKSSRETETYIFTHTTVRGSEWATHKHKPALPAVDDDGRLQPVAEAACLWIFRFFLSGERCAQRGRRTCRPAADRKDRTADHFLFPPGRGGRGHLAPHVVSGGREIFSCAIFELPCGYFSRL